MLQHQVNSHHHSPPNKSSLTEALSKRSTPNLPISTPHDTNKSILTTPTFFADQYSPQKGGQGPLSPMVSTFQTDNKSMIIDNFSASPMKGSIKQYSKSPTSFAQSLNTKTMKGFGTFVAENKGRMLKKTVTMTMAQNSSMASKSIDVGPGGLKFMEKEDWTEEKHCHICTRGFKKMNGVFAHHCRMCGRGVCGECSVKKINDNRVCDLCYYKAENKRSEDRRDDQLKSKNASIKTYKKQLLKEKEHLNEIIQQRYNLKKVTEEEKEEQRKAITRLQEEKVKLDKAFEKKKETNVKLKESVATDKTFMREKEIEFDLLRNKINYLKLQITQKKSNLESKQEELLRLKYHKARYQESPSFINLINTMNTSNKGPTLNDIDASNNSIVAVDMGTPQFYIKTKI